MRRVVCAAIRSGERIICGVRHMDAIMVAAITSIPDHGTSQWEQGFVDQRGEFLTRYEALDVASAAEQLIRMPHRTAKLFSEDLY